MFTRFETGSPSAPARRRFFSTLHFVRALPMRCSTSSSDSSNALGPCNTVLQGVQSVLALTFGRVGRRCTIAP